MNPSSKLQVESDTDYDGNLENNHHTSKNSNIFWIAAVVVLTILLIGVIIALVISIQKGEEKTEAEGKNIQNAKQCGSDADNETEVCTKMQCIQAASSVLSYMDSSFDPCEDFHKFVCGNFDYHNVMPPGYDVLTSNSLMAEIVYQELKEILEKPHKPNDLQTLNMAKKYYKSCLSQDDQMQQIEQTNELKRLGRLLGDWPVLVENWTSPASYSWEKQMAQLYLLGIKAIPDIYYHADSENSAHNIIHISVPQSAPFPDELLPGIDYETALNDSRDLLMMKTAVDKVPYEERDTKKITIKEIKSNLFSVDWETIFSIFSAKLGITDDESVIVHSWKRFKNAMNVFNRSSHRVVQNFVYKFFSNHVKEISPKRPSEKIPIWKSCIAQVSMPFDLFIGAEYVEKHMDMKKYKVAEAIAQEIKGTLIEKIKEASWLDDKTRSRALAKANQVIMNVGYPKNMFNRTFLMQIYGNVDIKENDFFSNNFEISKASMQHYLNGLREPIERGAISFNPATINAYNHWKSNAISFPAAILEFPAFSSEVPVYLNYGRFGDTVGHEITHGFDFAGHTRNEVGDEENWWTNNTYKKYLKKAECFRNQFNNIPHPIGQRVNGDRTLPENMADSGGLKLAYRAFMKFLSQHPDIPHLPGLEEYTPEQMFFLMYGNFGCEMYTKIGIEMILTRDTHSFGRYRINYSLKNLREFADAFKCPRSAKMRIRNRCEIW